MRKIHFLLFLFLVSCFEKDLATSDVLEKELDNLPDLIVIRPDVDFYDSVNVKANLKADTAKSYKKFNYTLLYYNVRIEFYKKESKDVETYITSDSAMIDEKTNNMYAYNKVYVWSNESETSLKTEFLEWNEEKRLLLSTKFVKIESPVEIIEGYGLESNQDLTNYKIFKVSGVITK